MQNYLTHRNYYQGPMLKKIVNAILWRTGLATKVPTFFWKPIEEDKQLEYLLHEYRKLSFPLGFDDERLNKSFYEQNTTWSKGDDYVVAANNVFVEPEKGLVILRRGLFLAASRIHPYVFPSFFSFLAARWKLSPSKQMDEAIHFDGYVSDNYYHFFNEVLNSFWMLEKANIKPNMPLIVGSKTYHTRHFQYLLKHNEWFASLPLLVLDGKTWLSVKRLYKPIALLPDKAYWLKTKALFAPPIVATPTRNIYLYRAPKFGRVARNMDELMPVLNKYGFETVDTGEMSIADQMNLFANTKNLIAIHGAGITNIIFSNWAQLNLLEILPGVGQLNTHYYWMAGLLGVQYDAIVSGEMDAQKVFTLEPQVLEKAIVKMMGKVL